MGEHAGLLGGPRPLSEPGRILGVNWGRGEASCQRQLCAHLFQRENNQACRVWALGPGSWAPSHSACLGFWIHEMGTLRG